MNDEITQHDARQRRCPMLGHDVPFRYCRAPGQEVPCRRVFDCWFETFDVEAFIRRHCTDRQIRQILAPRKDKLSSIVELIEKARKADDRQA